MRHANHSDASPTHTRTHLLYWNVPQVVKDNRVVVFVKGTRQQPMCGFSHRVLSLLNDCKADFEVVNVLDEVSIVVFANAFYSTLSVRATLWQAGSLKQICQSTVACSEMPD